MGVYYVPVEYSRPIQEKLRYNLLSNCYAYVKEIYPSLPSTQIILSNLGKIGEVGVLYYPNQKLYHYVKIEDEKGDMVYISETHMYGNTKTTRWLPKSTFIGFYSISD